MDFVFGYWYNRQGYYSGEWKSLVQFAIVRILSPDFLEKRRLLASFDRLPFHQALIMILKERSSFLRLKIEEYSSTGF